MLSRRMILVMGALLLVMRAMRVMGAMLLVMRTLLLVVPGPARATVLAPV
jgi:hypothetical protein